MLRFGFLFSLAIALGGCGQAAPKLDKSVTVDCAGLSRPLQSKIMGTHRECGHPDEAGVLHIRPETMAFFEDRHFKTIPWRRTPDGSLLCAFLRLSDGRHGYSYLAPDGRARMTDYPFDNECFPFRNEVAVSYLNGKAVFFDINLDTVKETNFVLALPFYKHLAKVCREMPTKDYDGEHFKFKGGQCGYIDTNFKVVVPIEYAYEDAPRLTGGKYDGVELHYSKEPVLNLFLAKLGPHASPVEAVFRPSWCNWKGCKAEIKEKFKIPQDLDLDNTRLEIMRFRLEDQTLWEGQALSDRDRNLTLHSLKQIDSLPVE